MTAKPDTSVVVTSVRAWAPFRDLRMEMKTGTPTPQISTRTTRSHRRGVGWNPLKMREPLDLVDLHVSPGWCAPTRSHLNKHLGPASQHFLFKFRYLRYQSVQTRAANVGAA